MNKNSALLTIGAALLLSLSFVDGGHAIQIDMNQTANLPIKQVSNSSTPCGGRSGLACRTQRSLGSGAMATVGSRYTSQVSTMPNPCGGRSGLTCKNQRLQGSGTTATQAAEMNSLAGVSSPTANILFGAGLVVITLVGLGARRLRHPHGHHA